jgi:O-antigen ligase
MAVPASIGYLIAHTAAHHDHRGAGWRTRLRGAADARSIWLAAAICLMLVGLVASLSRAGLLGLIAALTLGLVLRRRQDSAALPGWVVAAVGCAAILALARLDPVSLAHRIGAAGNAVAGRVEIWRATLPVLGDFWRAGTGAGTFETVMLAYQREPSLFRINAAHNHYLQVLTEGGVLMAIPVAVTAILFVRAAMRALRHDRSGLYLVRAGALCGLAGAAVQSIWDTGWTTPANAVLAAVLAAVVIHPPAHHPSRPAA